VDPSPDRRRLPSSNEIVCSFITFCIHTTGLSQAASLSARGWPSAGLLHLRSASVRRFSLRAAGETGRLEHASRPVAPASASRLVPPPPSPTLQSSGMRLPTFGGTKTDRLLLPSVRHARRHASSHVATTVAPTKDAPSASCAPAKMILLARFRMKLFSVEDREGMERVRAIRVAVLEDKILAMSVLLLVVL
jgi:hypothetical protein